MNPSGIEWRQTAQATHGMLRATTKEDSGGFAKRRRVGTHGNNTSQRLGCYYDEWRRAKTWHGTMPCRPSVNPKATDREVWCASIIGPTMVTLRNTYVR